VGIKAYAYLASKGDGLLTVKPILGRTADFKAFLAQEFIVR